MRTNVPDCLKDVLITDKAINMRYMEISTQRSQCKKDFGLLWCGRVTNPLYIASVSSVFSDISLDQEDSSDLCS